MFYATLSTLVLGMASALPMEMSLVEDRSLNVQLGPRPFFLVDDMNASPLKDKLLSCSEGPFKKSDFVFAHRGAPLQFPEHSRESYVAAAREGAGTIECDVTFTSDKKLVCRHSQCDLHTTTNILEIPELAAKCIIPFQVWHLQSLISQSICLGVLLLRYPKDTGRIS